MNLDKRLTWKHHIAATRKHLAFKARELYWIIGKHSPLSLSDKLLIYKAILKPVWTYGIELWGCASPTNISVLQRYQSKLPRPITQAPLYVSNQTLHQDLHIAQVRKVFHEKTLTHRISLSTHRNPLMGPLINQSTTRRLRRRWTFNATH